MNSTFGVHPNQSEIFEKWVQDPQFVVHVGRANERLIAVAASNISRSQDFSQYEVFGLSAVTHLKKNSLGWFLNLAKALLFFAFSLRTVVSLARHARKPIVIVHQFFMLSRWEPFTFQFRLRKYSLEESFSIISSVINCVLAWINFMS